MLVSPCYICRSKRSESNILVIRLYSQNEAEREQGTGNSLIFLFAEQSVARAASWQFAYLFIRRTKRSESSVLAIRLYFYSQNEAKREQRPGNSFILYLYFNYFFFSFLFFCSLSPFYTVFHASRNSASRNTSQQPK